MFINVSFVRTLCLLIVFFTFSVMIIPIILVPLFSLLSYRCCCFSHWITNPYSCFTLPYFYIDVYAMFTAFWYKNNRCQEMTLFNGVVMFLTRNPLLLVHHTIIPCIIMPIIVVSMWDKFNVLHRTTDILAIIMSAMLGIVLVNTVYCSCIVHVRA